MSKHWIKLHVDLLDDSKVSKFKDWQFRRFIMFLLAAGEFGKDGQLPPVDELAWRLRLAEAQVEEALSAFSEVGVAHLDANNRWWITNYQKYQAPDSDAERASRYRKNSVTNVTDDSNSDSISNSISSFEDNTARDCERLYQQTTGQITFPRSQFDKAIADLSTVLDHYKSIDAAVADGKRVFARWCTTQGKSGKTYSAVNTGWLGWWLDDIAPRPEKQELSPYERLFGAKP